MLRFLAVLPTLATLALAAPAVAQSPIDPGGPLVYGFVIDGLDGDRVDQGRAPYISSLLAGRELARATYFRESRSVMVAETNPNHAAMVTGAYAERSGIPGNSFGVYGPTDGESCPAVSDESQAPVSTDGTDPGCLNAETLFETVQRRPDADRQVTAAIFGKPKLASLFAGRKVDPSRYDADHLWTPCVQTTPDEPYCRVAPNRVFDEYAILDSTVMDEVIQTVEQGVVGDGRTFDGGGRRPNLTFVNFPAVDTSGHSTGAGAEYDAAIGRADGQIERFVANQKRLGLWERTVIVLLSDHSMDTTPERSSLGQRFQAASIPSGSYEIVQNGSAALVYVTDRRSPARFDLLRQMREAATDDANPLAPLLGPPAVEALYREPNPADGGAANTVATRHPAWRLTGERVGDLVVTARSGVAFNEPINPLAGNHGGPQTRDNFLAVVGGAAAINQRSIEGASDPLFDDTERNPQQAENVDLAATTLGVLGIEAPAQNQGRFLTEAFDTGALPALRALPGPSAPAAGAAGAAAGAPRTAAGSTPASCTARSGFASATATGAGRGGVAFSFARRTRSPVTVDLFQASSGRQLLGNRRVARFTGRSRSFRWAGRRGLRDGVYFARLSLRGTGGRTDVERIALLRRDGRFARRPAFYRRASCGIVTSFKLESPAFGGASNRAIDASYRLGRPGRVTVELLRGTRVVRRLGATATRTAGRTFRVRIASEGLRRAAHRIRIRVVASGRTTTAVLTARRL